jgi:hypothetical protein
MMTLQAVQIGVPRWMALALPDDATQEVAPVDWKSHDLGENQINRTSQQQGEFRVI